MPLFDADRKEVLNRMGERVIKDVAEAGGYGVVFGSSLDAAAREELANRITPELTSDAPPMHDASTSALIDWYRVHRERPA